MLPTHHEHLEPLHEALLRAVRLGQRRHLHGLVGHEGGLDQLALAAVLEHAVEHLPGGLEPREQLQREVGGLVGRAARPLEVLGQDERVEVHAAGLLDEVVHRHAAPRRGQVDLLALVRHHHRTWI